VASKDPEKIGRYQIIERVGRGGMGVLYRGLDPVLDREVAIKLMLMDFSEDDEQMRPRFYREARAAAKLQHRNIVTVFEFAEEGTTPYIVMEFLRGTSLADRMKSPLPLSVDDKLNIVAQLCAALQYAHEEGVVHRDVKPANVFVLGDGTVKLLDFGIAKLLSPIAQAGEITEVTSRMMTPEYASPEQARGETITTASDVYSLGVLLYELLTGHRPYRVDSLSLIEIIEAICEQEPAKPSTAIGRTDTSPGAGGSTAVTVTPEAVSKARDSEPYRLRRELEGDLDNIVLKAMRKEPQRRYASVEQFSEDIQRYFDHLPVIALFWRSFDFHTRGGDSPSRCDA
jgi:serine/threonine protein kinase